LFKKIKKLTYEGIANIIPSIMPPKRNAAMTNEPPFKIVIAALTYSPPCIASLILPIRPSLRSKPK